MAICVSVATLGFACLESGNRDRDGAFGGRDLCNCRRFWSLVFLSRVKHANHHKDGLLEVAMRVFVLTFGPSITRDRFFLGYLLIVLANGMCSTQGTAGTSVGLEGLSSG